MGFRFYRRIKLGGGFGLNLGKRGISWSVRAKSGSFGSKGFSIPLGIKGLSYQSRFKRKRKRVDFIGQSRPSNNNYSKKSYKYSDKIYTQSGGNSCLLAILAIGVIAVLVATGLGLLLIPLVIIFLIFKTAKNSGVKEKANVSNIEILDDYEALQITNILEPNEVKFNLSTSQAITLENIYDKFIYLENEIFNLKQTEPTFFQNYSNEQTRLLILHDICNVFHLLEIAVYTKSIEQTIWFETIIHLSPNKTENGFYQNDKYIIQTIQSLITPDFFVYSDLDTYPFTVLQLLKQNEKGELAKTYKQVLSEFTSLITTIDFSLTSKESKVLQLLNRI